MGMFDAPSLGKESGKAAKILKSFVDKNKIPKEAIANAKGVAIFSAVRAGMYLAGSGGSGIVVARLPDGSWSPPSAFSVRSGSVGIVYGVDVYDCVCVLNTDAAVEAYTKTEMNLGGAVALAAGPMNVEASKTEVKPVWVYTKSRGLYGGLTVDGTVIKEKSGINTEFYGSDATSERILKGKAVNPGGPTSWPTEITRLMEILKVAEGQSGNTTILEGIDNEKDSDVVQQ